MRKQNIRLTKEQQDLVTAHLSIVQWVIRESIHVNESIYGCGYDDLFQEGCIWLCHAAMTYDISLAQFGTYAKTVVRNGLLSYCRQLCFHQRRFTYLTEGEHGELTGAGSLIELPDSFTQHISMLETVDLLESRAKNYKGVAQLGIQALELRVKGLSVTEIARLYDVPPSHVGAWISRSTEKLRNDPDFLAEIA